MDEGDIWGVHSFPLDGTETNQSLTVRVASEAAAFVPDLLQSIFEGSVKPVPQLGDASYCTMIDRAFGQLDFNRTVRELHCRIRSCYPWPKAWARVNGGDIAITGVWGGFSELDNPELPDVIEPGKVVSFRKDRGIGVCCSDGILWITALQLPAKKELDFKAFVNGNRWILDSRFE
jgi:methionyl-tRNA formyltransferase